jgi:hypothetical protein
MLASTPHWESLHGSKAAVRYFLKKLEVKQRQVTVWNGRTHTHARTTVCSLSLDGVRSIIFADAKNRNREIKTIGNLAFWRNFAPVKISCYVALFSHL